MTHSAIHSPVPSPRLPATAPLSSFGTADIADVLLTWDLTTGWAHLARHHRGDPAKPVFVGFRELPADDPEHLRRALTKAGLHIVSEHSVDEHRIEFRLDGLVDTSGVDVPAARTEWQVGR